MASNHTQEQPDTFLLAVHARYVRVRRRSIGIALSITVAAVAGYIVWIMYDFESWQWSLVGLMGIAVGAACVVLASDPNLPLRPRPDTRLEVGQVLGCEVMAWTGDASGQGHTVRVFIGPCSTPETVLHGYIELPYDQSCDVLTGAMIGFRRHPTMRHLVWIEGDSSPEELTVAAMAADVATAQQLLADGVRSPAHVTRLTVGEEATDDRWRVLVELSLSDGSRVHARCLLPAEQLGCVAPGTKLTVSYEKRGDMPADGVILFPRIQVKRSSFVTRAPQ